MASVNSTPAVSTLLVLGATGDLAHRLLLPGLGGLIELRDVELSLMGSGVDDWTDDQWRQRVHESFKAGGGTGKQANAIADAATYLKADVTSKDDLRTLLDASTGVPAIFFALPPAVTVRACTA